MVDHLPPEAQARLKPIRSEPHVVTIGNFDGIHRGHLYLLDLLKQKAATLGAEPLVVTFEPHPISVLRPGAGFLRLTSPDAKIELLRRHGIQEIAVIPFTEEFSKVEAVDFLAAIHEATCPRAIVVGEGFRFGHARAGDGTTIQDYAAEHEIEADIVPRLEDGETIVSSSFVRTSLLTGELEAANQALGRRYRLSGRVVRGLARGKEMGYPTANLDLDDELLIPASGIYATFVHLRGRAPEPGMLYIGTSPTFDPRGQTVEVHILDFNDEIYDEDIEVELLARTREDMEFTSIDELVQRMQRDEREIRQILGETTPETASGENE